MSLPSARLRAPQFDVMLITTGNRQSLYDHSGHARRDRLRLRNFDYSAQRIYFITTVALNRRSIFLDARLAQVTIDILLEQRAQLRLNLFAYCLMPDHFHGLIGPGDSGLSLSRICGAFKSLSTRCYWQWYEGWLWQQRFYDHIIRNEDDYRETREYILLNPVRKGLVKLPEEWPYSGCPDRVYPDA